MSNIYTPGSGPGVFGPAGSGGGTAPSPAPVGYVYDVTTSTFAVTVTRVSGQSGTTLKVYTRPARSAGAWTERGSQATVAVGAVVTATGLDSATAYDWKLTEETSDGGVADGTHDTVTTLDPTAPALDTLAGDDQTEILRQPGRLSFGASAIAGAFPFTGGASLGYTATGVEVDLCSGRLVRLKAEDRKRGFNYLFVGDKEIALRVECIQWNRNAVFAAFPGGLSTLGASGHPVVQFPGTLADGTLMDQFARPLVFAPDNTREPAKVVVFPKALPWPEETAKANLKRKNPFSVSLVFKARPVASRGATALAAIADIRDVSL